MQCSSEDSDRPYESGTALRTHWTQEEDRLLRDLVSSHGAMKWAHIAKAINAQLKSSPPRNGKSCRLRWYNQLCPDIKKGPFTPEERDYVISMQQKLGNRWAEIAQGLPGRTDNAVKNFWNGYIRRMQDRAGAQKGEPSAGMPLRSKDESHASMDSSTLSRSAGLGHFGMLDYDKRAELLRDREGGVNVKMEPVTLERDREGDRERERPSDILGHQNDLQQSGIQCSRVIYEKRRELMIRVARKVMEVVAQRDKEDCEIMEELGKFDSEMHQQLLELVHTVSRSAQPRSSHSNPSRSSAAASDALSALFTAARHGNTVNISSSAQEPSARVDPHFAAALNTRLNSTLDYSHIPALQSLLAGSDVEQHVAENCIAHNTSAEVAANMALAQYNHNVVHESVPQFDNAAALEATLAPQLAASAMGAGQQSAGSTAADLFGDVFVNGLNGGGVAQHGGERARKLPPAVGLLRHGAGSISASDFFSREQIV